MEIDLHIHTSRYSGCSVIDPSRLIARAREVGLDGIALTEHGIRWPDNEIERLKSDSGAGDFLVIPGQEVACYSFYGRFQGEFLVFGFPKSLGSNKSVQTVIEMVHENGGILVAAHPFKRQKNGDGYYGSGDTTAELDIEGLEIEHPSYDDESRGKARAVMEERRIAGIGCSDAHELKHVGVCRTRFERDIADVEDLCREVRSRRLKAVNLQFSKPGDRFE